MYDKLIVKVWHGGKIARNNNWKYVGGESDMFEVEIDKCSYFELTDYVVDYGKYTNKEFRMFYLLPGKPLEVGLVELKNDSDVMKMLTDLGDDIKHICSLYVEAQPATEAAQPTLQAAHIEGQQNPPCIPTTLTVLEPQSEGDTFENEEGSDSSDEESEMDDLVCLESDTEDEEWKKFVCSIVEVNKEDQLIKKQLIENLGQHTSEVFNSIVVQEDGDSSYEESDAEVNSPGDSEDDDILGKKNKLPVPVVSEDTDWSKWIWVVGTRFPTRDAFKLAVRKYAVATGRNLYISVSHKNRHGRTGYSCAIGCPFKVYCSFNEKKSCYMVKSAVNKHNCQRNMAKNRQLTADFVATQFLDVFKAKPHWPAKEIQDAIKVAFKVLVTKWFAYKAKKCAHRKLHGSMKEHYSKIGSYLKALTDANPTSTFELVTVPPQFHGDYSSDIDVFYRIFVCFDGVKKGFLAGCRKLLCLDGCFLKTFLGGILLAAIGRDANGQMYPVAWAVVEGETILSWTWFMTELKKCLEVTDDGKGWTLISDQQKGLLNAVASQWSNAEHRNCARHIYANWHKKHRGDELKALFWQAARSYCEADYLRAIDEMKLLSTEAVDAFIKQDPRVFCRCYLKTETKSDVIVNNMAETFNGFIIRSRSKHIIYMLEDIRVAMMTRLTKMNMQMRNKDVFLCPRIQEKLEKDKSGAYKCEILPSSPTLFQVKALDDVCVDIVAKTCTCMKWQLTGLPCYHVCAVAEFLGRNAEEFVHEYYTKDMYMKAYEFTIPPLPSEKFWPRVDLSLDPPPIKVQPGRPKKNRKKDPHEDPKKPGKLSKHGQLKACSICKSKGHNKRKCTLKDKVVEAPVEPTRKRGRQAQASRKGTQVETAPISQPKRKRGRPKKAQSVVELP